MYAGKCVDDWKQVPIRQTWDGTTRDAATAREGGTETEKEGEGHEWCISDDRWSTRSNIGTSFYEHNADGSNADECGFTEIGSGSEFHTAS